MRKFLDFVEEQAGDKVPTIDYHLTGDEKGYNGDVIPCAKFCFCAYCSSACDGKTIIPDYRCMIFRLECMQTGFIVLGTVLGISIISMGISLIMRFKNRKRASMNANRSNEHERLLN
jgi:hypothetical protein